jgi:hypothetical protein
MINNIQFVPACLLLGMAIVAPGMKADSLVVTQPITITGAGGQSVSGNFTLSTPTDYAFLSNSAFGSATQGAGTYTDAVGTTFTILNPHTSTTVLLGSYQFAPGAPANTQVAGTLSLFYTLYSVDPNSPTFDPIADYVSDDQVSQPETFIDQQSNAGPPLQAVAPEPSGLALLLVGLILVLSSFRRKLA